MALTLLVHKAGLSQTGSGTDNISNKTNGGKELYLPAKVWQVPDNNNYNDTSSTYCYQRMVSSDNIALFWAKAFGTRPEQNPDTLKRFEVQTALAECERYYQYYVDTLQFLKKGHSVSDKYKILIYVTDSKEGTAYGGGVEDKIGILWTPAARIHKAPYGALAHELGHSFQYLVHADSAWGYTSAPEGSHGQTIFEMTSQYMLWQVYPEWMTFENYHLKSYLQKTHYAFLHETNQYHSPYVLEYWSEKHGKTFIGRLWQEAVAGEDPVMTYQRLTHINQHTFNDEMFDAARRFITWDMKRIEGVANRYANQHSTRFDTTRDGWLRIKRTQCPQNYGYNGIALTVPPAGSKVQLRFKGITKDTGFNILRADKAGWRYGFVAVLKNGSRIYADINSNNNGKASFTIPENTQHLWLVVSGAPKEHWQHLTDGKNENDEQWPYQIQLSGTALQL
ncbi:hypothetical protein GCM10011379_46650 [Filimonas zeae]|uniref:Avirulence protein n=2 Tax=Filimonas zeae TaxID=1737353 RepID=A0A917J588_9BACT|nr:hypothetical protein GCM10011379_46650 [Filimonas zeae]